MNKAAQIIGRNLKALRAKHKLTQHGLASKAGMSVVYIAFIEGGKKVPSIPALEDLAQALSCKVSDLIKGL